MKLNGSITIEAAVIVPLFTIIVLQIILLAIDCHDKAIINCASDKICMDMEFNGFDNGEYRKDIMEALSYNGTMYLAEKTIKSAMSMKIRSTITNIETENSAIAKNNPIDFVWITDAAKKLMKGD